MRIIDNFSFGDIVLADFVFSNQEGSKLRPCLILYKKGEDFVVLKMTSQIIATPSLLVHPDDHNYLRTPTYIDLQTIVTLQKHLFIKKIGSLDMSLSSEVRSYRSQFPIQR